MSAVRYTKNYAGRYNLSSDEARQAHAEGPPFVKMGLRSFVEATCIVVNTIEVSRRRLIKYVANKLGGTHYDPKRGDDDDLAFHLLDHNDMQVAGKRAVYFELLSAGQALVASPDLQRLVEAAARL